MRISELSIAFKLLLSYVLFSFRPEVVSYIHSCMRSILKCMFLTEIFALVYKQRWEQFEKFGIQIYWEGRSFKDGSSTEHRTSKQQSPKLIMDLEVIVKFSSWQSFPKSLCENLFYNWNKISWIKIKFKWKINI